MADDFGMGYALGQDSGGRNSEGFFGSEGIWAVIILAIIFGWGRNGFGGSGGGDQGDSGQSGGGEGLEQGFAVDAFAFHIMFLRL